MATPTNPLIAKFPKNFVAPTTRPGRTEATLLAGPVVDNGRVIRAVVVPDGSAVMELWDAAARAWVPAPDPPPVGWDELPFHRPRQTRRPGPR